MDKLGKLTLKFSLRRSCLSYDRFTSLLLKSFILWSMVRYSVHMFLRVLKKSWTSIIKNRYFQPYTHYFRCSAQSKVMYTMVQILPDSITIVLLCEMMREILIKIIYYDFSICFIHNHCPYNTMSPTIHVTPWQQYGPE